MTERRLLQAIVALLALQVVIQVVPGPFVHCGSQDTGITDDDGFGPPSSVFVAECVDSWWPIGADYVGWVPPPAPEPRATLAPGLTPLAP